MDDILDSKGHITFELLLDYADGILEPSQMDQIEEHIKNCELCVEVLEGARSYYEIYGKDREGLEKYLEETKKEILTSVDDALEPQADASRKGYVLWRNIAKVAAIILLLLVPTLLFLNKASSVDSLLEAHLEIPYDKPPITRGDFDPNMKFWNQVAIQYENKDYNSAIVSLESIIQQKETLSMAHFYTGLSYLYLKPPMPKKAIPHFKKVVERENPFSEQGLWYLGLAYLQADEKILCKETLEKITGYKYKEAQNLLDKLR